MSAFQILIRFQPYYRLSKLSTKRGKEAPRKCHSNNLFEFYFPFSTTTEKDCCPIVQRNGCNRLHLTLAAKVGVKECIGLPQGSILEIWVAGVTPWRLIPRSPKHYSSPLQ
jgi:hypothetical protein